MALSWDRLAELAVATLSAEERPTSVIYLDRQVFAAGQAVQVNGDEIPVQTPTAVAFVDLEPRANWGHRCRYLLIDVERGEIRVFDKQFPPFLTGVPPSLRLVWQGDAVPEWALATTNQEDAHESQS